MKLQRQAIRILEEGHFFLCEFIDPHRFRFNAKSMEPGDGLIHIGNTEGQVAQTAGLRIAGSFGTSRNAENLQFTVPQLQVQLIIAPFLPVVFPDDFKAEQIDIKIFGTFIVGYDDRNVVDGIQFQFLSFRRRKAA